MSSGQPQVLLRTYQQGKGCVVDSGGPGGDRTHDRRIMSPLLSPLSYRPERPAMVATCPVVPVGFAPGSPIGLTGLDHTRSRGSRSDSGADPQP